jgi:alginate O-acetyltransferase complex protein AlgI
MRLLYWLMTAAVLAWCFSAWHQRELETVTVQAIDFQPSDKGFAGRSRNQAPMPVQIGGGALRGLKLGFGGTGQTLTFALTIRADRTDFEITGADHALLRERTCKRDGAGLFICTTQVRLGAMDQFLIVTSPHPTAITAINVQMHSAKRAVQAGHISVTTILCLLALLAPLFWMSSVRTGKILICVLASAWFLAVDSRFFAGTIGLLAVFYAMLMMMENAQSRLRPFYILLLSAIAVLIMVKSIIPLSTQFFANPGELFLLPLGFSYFMIRIIDLGFKSYARQIACPSPLDYFSYLLFPPTLAAGPITTITEFHRSARTFVAFEDRAEGLFRMLVGLTKKVLADAIFAYFVSLNMLTGFYGADNSNVPVVLLCSALFVYLDFSAYSDMAIGLARWWGWKISENFNFPFFRRSMREFWKNWHMSLTQWSTRHVFTHASMEVRRSPRWMQIALPTFATMLVIGLWHGLEFVWVLWAAHHTAGILLGDYVTRQWHVRSAAIPAFLPVALSANVRALLCMAFVFYWFALGQAFTFSLSVPEAMGNYASLMSFGLFGW